MSLQKLVLCTAFAVSVACGVSAQNTSNSDVDSLNYALTLEHLEYAFYRDGLALVNNGSNTTTDPIYQRLTDIRDHEKAHVDALTAAVISLGGTPVEECTYDFGYTDAAGFITVARVLENVGVAAYDGAISSLNSTALQTVAATIATVEARHAAYLNYINDVNPFPQAFDTPLDPQSVIGLASGFIKNCSGVSLSIEPHPQLTATPLIVSIGSSVNITSDALTNGTGNGTETGTGTGSGDGNGNGNGTSTDSLWCVFYTASASTNSTVQSDASGHFCRVPEDAYEGDTFLFVSHEGVYELDNLDPIVAGPAIIYVTNSSTNSTTNSTA